MKWSYSTSRMFRQCPRKWYFHSITASHSSNESYRREAYVLKQLQSLYAWRGRIVDIVIEKLIIPKLLINQSPNSNEILSYAQDLMNKQLRFAKNKLYRDRAIKKSNLGEAFCALYDIEYNGELDNNTLTNAKKDAVTALNNLISSDFLEKLTESSSILLSQRNLSFKFEGVVVTCTPDLIAFDRDELTPIIIDWKVHAFGYSNAEFQLGLYALALSRVTPHKDFSDEFISCLKNPTSFKLIEYQLLSNRIREFRLTRELVSEIEDEIFQSSMQMETLVNGKNYKNLNIARFPTTKYPNNCTKCNFKKQCWRRSLLELLGN